MPRRTRKSLEPMLNSISTIVPLPITELTSSGLEMPRNALPNNQKHIAARIVDLPAPFSPMISEVLFLSNSISVKVFPVERKFFQRAFLNIIKFLNPVPLYKVL